MGMLGKIMETPDHTLCLAIWLNVDALIYMYIPPTPNTIHEIILRHCNILTILNGKRYISTRLFAYKISCICII